MTRSILELHGRFMAKDKKIVVVVSRFNEFITRRLLQSAIDTLVQAGAQAKNIQVFWVPGALEIPFYCKKAAPKSDVVIALGCVLRGDTYHYECVANEVTRGISQVALETGVPIATAIITADHLEQAIDRAGLKAGNKGSHAALAACEMMDLNEMIKKMPDRGKKKHDT